MEIEISRKSTQHLNNMMTMCDLKTQIKALTRSEKIEFITNKIKKISPACKNAPDLSNISESVFWLDKLSSFSTQNLFDSFKILEDKILSGECVYFPKFSEFMSWVSISQVKEGIIQIRAILSSFGANATLHSIDEFKDSTNNLSFYYMKSFGSFYGFVDNHSNDFKLKEMEKRLKDYYDLSIKNDDLKQKIEKCKMKTNEKKVPQILTESKELFEKLPQNKISKNDIKSFETFCKDSQNEENFRAKAIQKLISNLGLR